MLGLMAMDHGSSGSSVITLGRPHGRGGTTSHVTSFDRRELTLINGIYGRMLALGLARDYAIDHLKDRAVFSIFRRTSENPLYRVEKRPKDANRQGAWSVISSDGGTLKRGRDLKQVLKVFESKLIKAVD